MKKKREALILDLFCFLPVASSLFGSSVLCYVQRSAKKFRWRSQSPNRSSKTSDPESYMDSEVHSINLQFIISFFAVWYNQSVWVSYDYHILCFSSSKATVHQWPGIRFPWNWGHCCWTQRPSNGDFVWQGTKSADGAFLIRESHFPLFLFLFYFCADV